MAPGLNGRQTGTVPKKKSRSCGSQSQRLACEPFIQSSFMEWEQMSEVGNKNHTKKKSSTSHSETEADSLRHDLGKSGSSVIITQNGNGEVRGCSQDGFSNRINVPDQKQVSNKLSQIQNYVQQTAELMKSLKVSDSGSNSVEPDEEELLWRARESNKKLEALQKRKQDLLKLQEKAKKQLQEAQAEQSRLVARASSLNQEISSGKITDVNVQQLSQRLKTVQEIYNTRNQITENLNENQRVCKNKSRQSEDQNEMSDTETDFQLVADKMQELDAMKSHLGQIQRLMASISSMQNSETVPHVSESGDDNKEHTEPNSQNSSYSEDGRNVEDGNNNLMKLEQAKTKLNHLTQLLELVQSAQNATGLSPSYIQMVSNLVNEETNSCTESPSPPSSGKSPQRNSEEVSVQTMKVMTKELEETTAAMKEERDRLLAARQELQDIAKRLPLTKSEAESVSPDYDSENEPPSLKPATFDSVTRDNLNELTEAEQSSNYNDGSPYTVRQTQSRNRQRGVWNTPSPSSNCIPQERRSKNESVSRSSNQSSRGGIRTLGRDQPHWCSSPSISCCNDRPNAVAECQQQLEMSGNLCEMVLSESFPRAIRPNEISLQEMFSQHQMLTKTVAQCSQLLWLQQKQIIELRNAIMLQFGSFPNQTMQPLGPNQRLPNASAMGNPYLMGPSNIRQNPSVPLQQQQQQQSYLHPLQQNVKLNVTDIQTSQRDFPDQYLLQGNQTSLNFPDGLGCDMRSGSYNRFNPSNVNHNFHQNLSLGYNNRGPNGNSVVPEDSGALNNQVPPGNRANNYWDNFRSYSRQNLLSNTKSKEDSEMSRRCLASSSQDRPPRDSVPSTSQNNQAAGTSQQFAFNPGNYESSSNEQFLLPSSQNLRVCHGHVMRSFSAESQRKNESRHQENDSRNLNASVKNDSSASGRTRNPDSNVDIRSVRNDVSQSFRNTDNVNSSRNFVQLVRDIDNDEFIGNNKKRLERTRCRNEGLETLNNRGYQNTSLWENVYAEVSNFIRANESRPHFLLQLFRDLQQVTSDGLRQRTLVAIQETVNANNLTERTSNSGGNVNIIENQNRNNIRENRSNLNRNQAEDPSRIDELFCHLRENQNTIRENIGMSSFILGGNLENPNISNIRELGSSRNNLESEGLRDLKTYFEASLCNYGHNSTLENPNMSNIRENLTRRPPGMSDFENVHPKNVYLNIYDNATEFKRRFQDSLSAPEFGSPFRNFELENDFLTNGSCDNAGAGANHFEQDNNLEGAVGGRAHIQHENRDRSSRFSVLDGGVNFSRSRQFLGSANDSGIDINFNNDDRKKGFSEGDTSINETTVKANRNAGADGDIEGAVSLRSEWDRHGGRDVSFDSSLNLSKKDVASPLAHVCDLSFCHCHTFQQSDNGDLAEADQSRNEETSGAESDSGFLNTQNVGPELLSGSDRNLQSSESNFSSQNIPEAERAFMESKNCENDCSGGAEGEGSLSSGNAASKMDGRGFDGGVVLRKSDADGFYYQLNAASSSESTVVKSEVKHRKRAEEPTDREASGDFKKSSCKNSTNKFRDGCYSQGKYSGASADDFENRKTDSDSAGSATEGRHVTESRDSLFYGAFQHALEKSAEAEKGNTSPEAESDWECESGLDQVPTRLNKSESSRKSEDSGGSFL